MIKVSQLPVDPGPAAWNEMLGFEAARPTLTEKTTTDWLIIGAGFAGLTAARRLSELHPADQIVVLDASRIAHGPTGRNSGFMIDVPHDLSSADYGGKSLYDLRQIRLNRAAIDYSLQAKDRWEMNDEAIIKSGKINGAMTARGLSHNDGFAKHLDKLSESYERLNAQAMYELTGTHCYIDGLFSPGTVMMQPAMFIRNIANGLESNRVQIYESSPVISLNKQGTDWEAITPQGSVSAANAILTVNGHLESFGFFQQHLLHVFTYGSMTRPLSTDEVKRLGGQRIWALTPADPLGTTVRRISGTGGDRIIIRNRATYDPSLNVSDKRLQKIGKDHDKSFKHRFPMLRNVEMSYRWGGRLCLSRNGASVFGELDNNLFAACCQNGLGTAKGTISGKLIAELASKQHSALLEDQLADASPSKLPPAPITQLGATARLKWGEYRAGKEL